MAVPDAAGSGKPGTSAIGRLLASDIGKELLAIMREIHECHVLARRLAYSSDEAAALLGILRELIHDLVRTGLPGRGDPFPVRRDTRCGSSSV